MGMLYKIGTIRGYALMNGFDCGVLLIWVPYWFTYWSFFLPTSLTGALGGTAGEFAFLNISARVLNDSFCPFPSLTIRIAVSVLCSAQINSCAA